MRCDEKIAYPSMLKAVDVALWCRRRGEKMEAYKCPFCAFFHVGHPRPGDRGGQRPPREPTRTTRSQRLEIRRKRAEQEQLDYE